MKVIWKRLRAFSLFGFLVLGVGSQLQAAPTPFVCDGTPYTVINDPSMLQRVEQNLSITDIGTLEGDASGVQVYDNGIAYNILDNFIYGIESDNDNGHAGEIVRIGSNQKVEYLGDPTKESASDNAWSGIKNYIGTMDSDGNYYGLGSGYLYIVHIGTNPTAGSITYKTIALSSNQYPADITFNVTNGKVYGTKGHKLYEFDVSNGNVTEIVTNPKNSGDANDALPSNAGGAWSTSKGELYFYSNQDGTLTKVEILSDGTATVDFVGNVDPNAKFDATACRPPYITKEASTKNIVPGGTYSYQFKIYNPFTKAIDVNFTDVLPSALTYVANSRTDLIDSNGASLEPAKVTEFNSTAIEINNITLPINGYVEFNVSVLVDPNVNSSSNIVNTAFIHYGVNTSPSDDPDTGLPGDGTTVTINVAPNANDDSADTDEDTAVVINVDDNDTSDANNGTDLNLSSVSISVNPVNGTITDLNTTTGDITYLPNTNYFGTDTFTYELCDNGLPVLCDEANVTVTVNPVNDPTVVKNDSVTTDEDKAVDIDVLTNDTDVEGSKSPVASVTQGANGTVTINGNGTVKYIPNSNFNGTDTFTYTNGEGNTATVTVTVNPVNDPTVVKNDSVTTDEDKAVDIDVLTNDTDVEGSKSPVASVTQGANGTVTINGNGTVKYTPNSNFNGTDTFTYTNGEGNTATVTVTVNPVNDPTVVKNDSATTDEDKAVDIDVLANDTDVEGSKSPVASVTQGAYGTVTINGNGTVKYTPNSNFNGTDTFTYTNGEGNTATVTVTVNGVNDTPVVDTPIADQSNADADTPSVDVSGNFSDPDGDTLTYTATGLPTELTISPAGVISGTIDKAASQGGTGGVYSVTVTAKDPSGATVTDTFTWTVTNPAPIANADTGSTPEDTQLVVAAAGILGNDTDPDGDTLSVTEYNVGGNTATVGNPLVFTEGNLTMAADGSYTFDPVPDFNGPVPAVTYAISDGNGGTSSSTLTITVTAVNDTPVVDTPIVDQRNADADTPSVDVSGNFSDPDGDTLIYTATGLPTGLTISPAGVISGTIDKAASQGGTGGVYSVTVTAKDPSGATVTDTFTWTVTNPAPIATDNAKSTNEDTPVSGNVLIDNDNTNGIDSDPDGDTLSVTQFVVDSTTYTAGQTAVLTEGNLTIASTGAYTFTPTENSTDNMPQATYTLSDGEGGTDTATLDMTVNAVNDAPVANPDTGSTPEDTQFVVPATGLLGNDTDLDGDTLSVTGYNVGANTATVGNPLVLTEGNLTVAADGSYTFDPAPDFNGAVPTVTYNIEDINGEIASSTLDITVTAVNDAPVAEDDSQSTPTNTSVSVPVLNNDHDIENDSLVITDVNTTGTNGTVTFDANGTVIFTPKTDFIGTTTFTYTISDGNGGKDTATVTITVTDPTYPSSNTVTAVADSASTEMDTNIDIPVLINDYDPENDDFNITDFNATTANGGTVTLNDNGTPDDSSDDYLTYEPATDFVGNDTFEYVITDGNGNRDIAIVTVTVVDPAADAVPNAVADAAITDQDSAVTINVLGNDTHPDNDDLNITAFTQPANGVVTLDDGGTPNDPSDDQLVFTPNSGFDGHDTFMYTITDSNGDSALAAVTITIDTVPPAVSGDEKNGISGEPAVIDVVSNDNPGTSTLDPATVQIIDPVNGETTHYVVSGEGTWDVAPVTGEITFTPEAGYVGDPTPIEYNVYDLNGNSGTGTVTLNYGPLANDDMNDQSFEGETVTVNVLENDKYTSTPLDPMSISLVVPDNATDIVTDNEGDIVGFMVPGEGEWSVNEDTGVVTFEPDEDLSGYPTPVEYTVKEESGEESNRAIIEILYEVYTGTGLPNATDNLNIPVSSYNPIVIDVLANGDSFGGNGAGTTEITFTQTAHGSVALDDGGTPSDPTDDVLIYTPAADVNNITDSFTYTITDALGNTSTANVTVNVSCTSSQASDSGDALSLVSMLLLAIMTAMSGLYLMRKEEGRGKA